MPGRLGARAATCMARYGARLIVRFVLCMRSSDGHIELDIHLSIAVASTQSGVG
jgi:hypothetical protein